MRASQQVPRSVVAHCIWNYLSVTANWIYQQLIRQQRYDPLVLATRVSNLDQFPLARVHCFAGNVAPEPLLLRVSRAVHLDGALQRRYEERVVRRAGAQLVHAHFGNEGHRRLALSRALGVPQVTSFYGYDLDLVGLRGPEWVAKYRELFSGGELFLAEGSHSKRRLIELGCPPDKVQIHHLGVDLNEIPFQPRRMGADGALRILIVGTFKEKKGIPYALAAVGELKRRGFRVAATVIGDSTGAPPEEAEKTRILETIAQYDLVDTVRRLGFQPHRVVREEMVRHHVILSPSVTARDGDTEGGSPVTLTEALASGMPVLSTWHCDIPEVVVDGQGGYLAEERDVEGLVERMVRLIERPQSLEELGREGRRHVERDYNIDAQVLRLEATYSQLIPGSALSD